MDNFEDALPHEARRYSHYSVLCRQPGLHWPKPSSLHPTQLLHAPRLEHHHVLGALLELCSRPIACQLQLSTLFRFLRLLLLPGALAHLFRALHHHPHHRITVVVAAASVLRRRGRRSWTLRLDSTVLQVGCQGVSFSFFVLIGSCRSIGSNDCVFVASLLRLMPPSPAFRATFFVAFHHSCH